MLKFRSSQFFLGGLGLLVAGLGAIGTTGATAEWTTNGPPGPSQPGSVVVDPRIAGTIYASGELGLAKSVNSGQAWTSVVLSDAPAVPLAVDSAGAMFAAVITDLHEIPPAFVTRIYKSTDDGVSWTQLLQDSSIRTTMLIDPQTPTTIYRVSTFGPTDLHFPVFTTALNRSTDGGVTWVRIDGGLDGNAITALAVAQSSTLIYAASVPGGTPPTPLPPAGVFRSSDSGATWERSTTEVGAIVALAVDPVDPATVFAAGSDGVVFASSDAGRSFILVSSAVSAVARLTALVVDPIDPRRLYAATIGDGVFHSVDGGVVWSSLGDGLTTTSRYVTTLVIDPEGNYLHATSQASGVTDFQLRQPRASIDTPDRGLDRPRVVPRRSARVGAPE